MLIEIPDPEVILGVVAAFFVGIFGLFLYYKIKPFIKLKPVTHDSSYFERLEYYETQLIDMKIQLDALDIGVVEQKPSPRFEAKSSHFTPEIRDDLEHLTSYEIRNKRRVHETQVREQRPPNMGYQNATEYVLRLITNKPLTSRDIQITLEKSREHTSRLMKKLFEDGFVKRNTNTKPYTYSITEKGKQQLGAILSTPTMA